MTNGLLQKVVLLERALANKRAARENVENELKKCEFFLNRSLIKLSPLGIGVINTESVIVDGNQALASMLGYEIEELLGMTLGDISHPDDLKNENELIDSLVNNSETSFSMEKRYRHKCGDYFWVNISVSKALDIAGSGVSVLVSSRISASANRWSWKKKS